MNFWRRKIQRNKFFEDKSESSESQIASDQDEYDSQLESSGPKLEEICSSDEEDADTISEWIPYWTAGEKEKKTFKPKIIDLLMNISWFCIHWTFIKYTLKY